MTSIIINHLGVALGISIFVLITGGGGLPASAAEGFFLLSGLMVGYIYGPKILLHTKPTFKKLWKRAGWLYMLCISFTLLYTFWTLQYPETDKFATLYSRDGISFLYNTFLLRYSFGWADFLSRYAWFMAAAPILLWLIAKGRVWLVAGTSLVIWLVLRKTELFLPFSAWQIIFVIGIIIGYYYPRVVAWYQTLSSPARQVIHRSTVSITCVTFFGSLICFTLMPHLAEVYPAIQNSVLWSATESIRTTILPFTDKNTLAPLRLAVSIVWFIGLYFLVRPHEKTINQYTGGVLQLFGKNSLYVYGWHAFILFLIEIYLRPTGGSTNVVLNSIVALSTLYIVYLLTKYRHLFTRAKQQLADVLSPSELLEETP